MAADPPIHSSKSWRWISFLILGSVLLLTRAVLALSANVSADGYRLNVRRGPGTQYDVLRILNDGDPITLTDNRRNGWVELADGGWVAGNLVRSGGSDGPGNAVVDTGGYRLNIRNGPGVQFDWIGVLNNGDPIRLNGVSRNGWVQLADGGWVAGNLIRRVTGEQPRPTPDPQPAPPPRPAPTPAPDPEPDPEPDPAPDPDPDPEPDPEPLPAPQPPQAGVPSTAFINVPQTTARVAPDLNSAQALTYFDGDRITLSGQQENGWAELIDGSWISLDSIRASTRNGAPSPGDQPLQFGSSGAAVGDLQRRLRELGFLPETVAVTRYFGEQTELALIGFQTAANLTANGIATEETIQLLYSDSAPFAQGTANGAANGQANDQVNGDPVGNGTGNGDPNGSGNGQPRTTTVTSTALVRANPNPQSRVLSTLPNGATVRLTGERQNGWVELASGGWILAEVVPPMP